VVVAPTGAETELLLEVGGEQLIVVLHGRTTAKPDDRIGLVIDGAKAHLFDEGSGQRID
jgi:multiple sugar transport system ATP-binding protein